MADARVLAFRSAPSPAYDLNPLVTSWLRNIRSRNLSVNTQLIYERHGRALAAFLLAYEAPDDDTKPAPEAVEEIHREHMEVFFTALLGRTSPGNTHQAFRSLKTFFNWLVDEEEIDRSPMRTLKAPEVPEAEVPVISDQDMRRLLKACAGRDFESRRDMAVIMLLLDTGVRLEELTLRQVNHLDLDVLVFHVLGKGSRERAVPIGRTAAQAVDRYLRAYVKHMGRALESEDPLWIGVKTRRAMTKSGIGQMVERRAKQAQIDHIHPHQFRHTFAHLWKLQGGNEDALMRITGWRSREMLNRYGASAATERARVEHKELSPGDRLMK